ncbi:hypothetical protein F4678DRAFT_209858 [Xylaria arbuscula]|nr:hypothetical protein F4678DRAFT_209858 [Xylaria arbuscula]
MPPLCSEKRCPQNIGRRRRVSSISTGPTLFIRENLADGDDEAEESDENISPDADKSGIRFALETKRDDDDDDNDKGDRQRGDSDNSDNNGGGQNRREGDGRNGRPPFFQKNDNEGRRFGANSDGGDNGEGGKGEDNNDSGDDGNGGGGGDDNGDGKDGNNNGNPKGKGRGGGGNSGKDHGGSNSSSNDNPPPSPPPPPPPSATSTTSTVSVSTTTPVVISTTSVVSTTSVPTTETTTPFTSQESITTVTALPELSSPPPILTLTANISPTSIAGDGVDTPQPSTSLASVFPDSSIPVPVPAPVPTQTNNRGGGHHNGNNNNNNSNNGNNNNNNGGNGSRLSKTSEEILVATGALGVFIVLCFLLWLIYRSVKKSQKSGRKYNNSPWLARLMPWGEKPETNDPKVSNGVNDSNESLPAYDAGNRNSMEAYGYYDQRKLELVETENMAYPPAAAMLRNEMAMRQTADGQQQLPRNNSVNQYPQLNGQIMDSDDADSTLRSRMPDPYYNQSEFARQPSDAYNPAQRRVYRASEISSLSSGFGDGDIIMPPPNVVVPKTPTASRAVANADSGNGNSSNNHPFSWMSRTGPEQQRDTVYTTTSDRRSRFRSVNSWVDQQMRRMKKAS